MNRYTLLQSLLIYCLIFVFLLFMLLPFFEMFMASLRPMTHLFRTPYQFWSDDFSFDAYYRIWDTVPLLSRYILNSVFIASSVTVITMVLVVPAAYAYARLDFRGQYVHRRGVTHSLVPNTPHLRTIKYLLGHDRTWRRLSDTDGNLATAHLPRKNTT